MLRLAFDFIIAWREIRARPNAYKSALYPGAILVQNLWISKCTRHI